MGYHVTILRSQNGQISPISKSEIESLIGSFPGSNIAPDKRNKDILNIVISKGGKEVSWLTFDDGELWTKNPEGEEIQVMIDIASQLGARVRGDEFETYISPSETYFDQYDLIEKQKAEAEQADFFRSEAHTNLNIKRAIILIFMVVAGIAFVIGKMFEAR